MLNGIHQFQLKLVPARARESEGVFVEKEQEIE